MQFRLTVTKGKSLETTPSEKLRNSGEICHEKLCVILFSYIRPGYVEAETGLLQNSTLEGLSWTELVVVEEAEGRDCECCSVSQGAT